MPRARVRRPLIALIALLAALVIGYTVQALRSDHTHPSHSPLPTVSSTR